MPSHSTPKRPARSKRSPAIRAKPADAGTAQVQRSQALRTLERLAAEISRIVDRLHPPIDGPRGLARAIDADVSICQRVLSGIRARGSASQRLAKWPGVLGVRLIASRILYALGQDATSAPAVRAVRDYELMVGSLARSHAGAVRALRALEQRANIVGEVESASSSGESASLSGRRVLYRAVSEMLGYTIDASSFVCAIRPLAGQPDLMEGCSAIGLLGLRGDTRNVFITSHNTQTRQVAGDLATEVRWTPLGTPLAQGGTSGVLEEFSSRPTPLCAVDAGDGVIRQMVQPAPEGRGGRCTDVVLARHWSPDANPQYMRSQSWSQILRLRHPVKRMVMDVYLHRSMLTAEPPTIAAYYWHPALPSDPRRHWHDQLPGTPTISLLRAANPAPTAAWLRQGELTTRLFELVGWSTDEFVGFRCEQSFPIWGAAYYMTFDMQPAAPLP